MNTQSEFDQLIFDQLIDEVMKNPMTKFVVRTLNEMEDGLNMIRQYRSLIEDRYVPSVGTGAEPNSIS